VLGTILEALKNIQYTEPARPRQTISRFNSDVEAIILKCLAKDPDQRYESAGELKKEVQRWLDGLPIVAKSISSVYLLRKIIARHRYTTTVVASLLVILCSSASVSFHFYRRECTARLEAESVAERARAMAQEQKAVAEGAARLVADLMMRNSRSMRDPSSWFEFYGLRRPIRGASTADRTSPPVRGPVKPGGTSHTQ
jgi:serine/threonine protein kinase